MQWDIAIAGCFVGFVIGLTGMGGGALMTPILVLVFHVDPSAAISSDVVASFFLKPVGGGVHARRGTVNWRMVRWLSVGSVPAAFAGAFVIDRLAGQGLEDAIKHILGWMLLVAGLATLAKVIVQVRRRIVNDTLMDPALVRPLPTVCIGVLGGFTTFSSYMLDTLTLADGSKEVCEVAYPRGHAGNPITDAEVEAKFRRMAEPKYGKPTADKILARCWDLENIKNVRELIEMMG